MSGIWNGGSGQEAGGRLEVGQGQRPGSVSPDRS